MRAAAALVLVLAIAACARREPPAQSANSSPASPAPPAAAPVAPPAPEPIPEALLKAGEDVFTRNCATCHMADGNGVPFLQPAIKGSALLSNADPQYLLTVILRGSPSLGEAAKAFDNDMPPLDQLTDTEIAALATYVRQHFAAAPINKPVTPPEVAVARARPGMPQ